jgi:hypothetical protein
MTEMFRWFSQREVFEGWLLFGSVILILGIIPYTPSLYKIARIIIRKEKAKIHSFEYALSPDHKLAEIHQHEFYLLSPTMHFIIQGGEILITWHVTGAWRIDIEGIGKNLKGNAAWVIADRARPVYYLTAHTLKGRLTAVLQLPVNRIFDVKTTSFAQDINWTYEPVLYPAKNFPFTKISGNTSIGIPAGRISIPESRIQIPEPVIKFPVNSRLWPAKNYSGLVENDKLNSFLDAQTVVQYYPSNLCDYHENGEHLFYSSAKKLREKLRQDHSNQHNKAQ